MRIYHDGELAKEWETFELRHEISNNVVCATSKGSDQPYEEHEDSLHAVDWSCADPWVFASLSYDGRLVINRVPRAEKYKILL